MLPIIITKDFDKKQAFDLFERTGHHNRRPEESFKVTKTKLTKLALETLIVLAKDR